MKPSTHPIFWRDSALPYVELRQVLDGRKVSYAPHSHEEWSIGAILDGQSEFLCADRRHIVESGALVMMNPNVVHSCNPSQNTPWAYYMMHLDKAWLADLLQRANVREVSAWQDSSLDWLMDDVFYHDFLSVCESLMSVALSMSEKERVLETYFTDLFAYLDSSVAGVEKQGLTHRLDHVAEYLHCHCLDDTPIEEISEEFGFSAAYFVRAFKRHFNMTPHAYRLNRRVQLSQQALKEGQAIVDVAQAAGFSDQAHFQRVFKKRVAATPDQYRRSVS